MGETPPTSGPRRFENVWPQQFALSLYVFGPITMFFFLPLLFFRLPLNVFLSEDRMAWVSGHFVLVAVLVCLVWFTVAVGIVIWPCRSDRVAQPRDWSTPALWMAFLGLSVVGSAVALIHALRVLSPRIEEIAHQGSLAPSIAFVLGIYLLRRGLDRNGKVIVVALSAMDIAVSLGLPVLLSKVTPAALNTVAILYGLTAAGVSWRRQAAVALILVPFILIALPLKEYLRMQLYDFDAFHRGAQAVSDMPTSSAPLIRVTFAKRLAAFDPWVHGLRFHRANGPLVLVQFGATRVIQRINRLSDLAYVVQMTPSIVPYARGVTFEPILTKLLPRFFWPNKPRENVGQFYGHRYGFLDPPDSIHSVNLPMVTEGWMNAGWVGVVLSGGAAGLLLRAVWMLWIGASGAPANVLVGMAVVGTAADGESNFSIVMGGVLHAVVVYWAIAAAISWWDRRYHRTAGTL